MGCARVETRTTCIVHERIVMRQTLNRDANEANMEWDSIVF